MKKVIQVVSEVVVVVSTLYSFYANDYSRYFYITIKNHYNCHNIMFNIIDWFISIYILVLTLHISINVLVLFNILTYSQFKKKIETK